MGFKQEIYGYLLGWTPISPRKREQIQRSCIEMGHILASAHGEIMEFSDSNRLTLVGQGHPVLKKYELVNWDD